MQCLNCIGKPTSLCLVKIAFVFKVAQKYKYSYKSLTPAI